MQPIHKDIIINIEIRGKTILLTTVRMEVATVVTKETEHMLSSDGNKRTRSQPDWTGLDLKTEQAGGAVQIGAWKLAMNVSGKIRIHMVVGFILVLPGRAHIHVN